MTELSEALHEQRRAATVAGAAPRSGRAGSAWASRAPASRASPSQA